MILPRRQRLAKKSVVTRAAEKEPQNRATGDGLADYRNVNLVGSDTLVILSKSHYILTAAHVWHSGLKKHESTGLTLRDDVDHCFPILNAAIAVRELPETKLAQWGPDIVLLRIPDSTDLFFLIGQRNKWA